MKFLPGVFILLFFVRTVGSAQEIQPFSARRDQIGPSPTVGTLGEYGGVDVKKSTGGISKNIPLFTLEQGMIQYSPSIEYFSTGVQVNEWGGKLGIGWNDNFCATIHRMINTIPDEYANGRVPGSVWEYFQMPATAEKYAQVLAAENNANLAMGANPTFDPEYDIFSYNIFGNSGQFIIVNNKAILLTHREKISIEILSVSPTFKFCLKDVKGFKYYFQNSIEYTSLGFDGKVTPGIATAWFVDRIKSPVGDELNFGYNSIAYACKTDFYQNYTYKNGYESGDFIYPEKNPDATSGDPQELYYIQDNSYGVSKMHTQTKSLSSVAGNNFRLSFKYDESSREDLKGAALLKEIILSDKNDAKISSVSFAYDTHRASSQFRNLYIVTDDDLYPWSFGDVSVRYFLNRVVIGGYFSSQKQEYSFLYDSPANLPPRFSCAQDEGGYFNGKPNTWFLPKSRIENFIKLNPRASLFPMTFTGDRSTTTAATAGILRQITYPTGGTDVIDCELNSYTTMVGEEVTTTPFSGHMYRWGNDGGSVNPEEFDWASFNKATIRLTWDAFGSNPTVPPPGGYNSHYVWFRVLSTGRPNYHKFYVDGVAYDSIKLQAGPVEQFLTITVDNQSPGENYNQDLGLSLRFYGASMHVFYELTTTIGSAVQRDLPLPGLRVKQVTTKSNASPDIVKTYSYKKFSPEGNTLSYSAITSSNVIDATNVYARRMIMRRQHLRACADLHYYIAYSGSRSKLDALGGNFISYSHVTEHVGDAFTASIFNVSVNDLGHAVYGDEFFLTPKENSAWDNGLEGLRYQGVKSLSQYSVVKAQRWDYEIVTTKAAENGVFYRRYSDVESNFCDNIRNYEPFTIVSYNLWNRLYYLRTATETSYADGGQGKIVSKTDYSYDATGLLASEAQIDSRGAEKLRTIRYPKDVNVGVYAGMVQENMLDYPVEEVIRVNQNVVGSKLTTYKTYGGNFVQDKIFYAEVSTPLSSFYAFDGSAKDPRYTVAPEVEFIEYNALGKILKLRERSGLYTHYVWAYGGNYPVARIETSVNTAPSIVADDTKLSGLGASHYVKSDVTYLKSLLSNYSNRRDCRISLYTYMLLVGMTSQTDPNGLTTFFEYDDMGRLSVTKDENENIVKVHTYHYQE